MMKQKENRAKKREFRKKRYRKPLLQRLNVEITPLATVQAGGPPPLTV